mgnify:CR=1 FL=1
MNLNFNKLLIIKIASSILFIIFFYTYWDFFILYPMGFMGDDSFFYTQIAYNVGVNKFSSWDGINLTNSYHLLWQGIISLVSLFLSFFTNIKEHHLMGHLFIYFFILFIFLKYYSRNYLDSLVLTSIIVSGYFLLDNITVIVLLFIIYKEIEKYIKNKKFSFLLLIVFFLIPLARIDAIALIGFIPLFFLLKTKDKFYFYLLLSLLLGLLVNLSIYYFIAGEFYSVSSYVKMNQNLTNTMEHRIVKNVIYSNFFPLGWLTLKMRGYILFLFFIIFIINFLIFKKKQSVLFWGVFAGLYSYFFINFFSNYIDTWYYSVMFASLFILLRLANMKNFTRIISSSFLYLFVISLFFGKFYNSIKYFDYRAEYIGDVKKIENYIPQKSKIYQYDLAGHLSFYSKVKVINGDGRVNSFDYANALLNNGLSNYLVKNKICFLTDIFTQKSNNEKVLVNQSGLLITYEDVNLIKKLKHFSIYKLKKCYD